MSLKKRSAAKSRRDARLKAWLKPKDPRPGYSLIGLYSGPVPAGFSSDNDDAAFDDL